MKRSKPWLVAALGLVLLGAFVVSASSTWLLGERHHLDPVARLALVLMLEVGNVTGAAIYVATRSTALRVRAGLVVGIATSVAATGGVQAYGFLIGVPVAAVLLLLVDTIAVFWHASTGDVSDRPDVDHAPVDADRVPAWEPTEHPLDAPLREEAARLREWSRVEWPVGEPIAAPVERLHVVGYEGPVDEPYIEHPSGPFGEDADPPSEPETEGQAAARLIGEGFTTERALLEVLTAAGHPVTRYRVKKYLGNTTAAHRRMGDTG